MWFRVCAMGVAYKEGGMGERAQEKVTGDTKHNGTLYNC